MAFDQLGVDFSMPARAFAVSIPSVIHVSHAMRQTQGVKVWLIGSGPQKIDFESNGLNLISALIGDTHALSRQFEFNIELIGQSAIRHRFV